MLNKLNTVISQINSNLAYCVGHPGCFMNMAFS